MDETALGVHELGDERCRAILDAEDRLVAAASAFRYPEVQPQLDLIASEAAHATGFPIGAISIVLRRSQSFLAVHGTPPDLDSSRSTDRSVSFSRRVVAERRPCEVVDLLEAGGERLDLLQSYGMRAYAGVPIHVDGQAIGALCVIDVVPHALEPGEREKLLDLAARVDRVLRAAASAARRTRELTGGAARPAFAELRNILCRVSLAGGLVEAALADLQGGSALLAAAGRGELAPEHLVRNAAVLQDGPLAVEDARALLRQNAEELRKAAHALCALERAVAPQISGRTWIHQVVSASLLNAEHETRMVGGVHLERFDPNLAIDVEPSEAIATLTTLLVLLARQLAPSPTPRLVARIEASGDAVALRVDAEGLAPAGRLLVERELLPLLAAADGIVASLDAGGALLRFRAERARVPDDHFERE